MIKLFHILVPRDLSPRSDAALDYALLLMQRVRGTILDPHVAERESPPYAPPFAANNVVREDRLGGE